MYAYELLPRLTHLVLTINKEADYWEERLEFIGTNEQYRMAEDMEKELCSE